MRTWKRLPPKAKPGNQGGAAHPYNQYGQEHGQAFCFQGNVSNFKVGSTPILSAIAHLKSLIYHIFLQLYQWLAASGLPIRYC
jgi:hypothetical protein